MAISSVDNIRNTKRALYLPGFGLGLVAQNSGETIYLVIGILYLFLAASTDQWISGLTGRIRSLSEDPAPDDVVNEVLPRAFRQGYSAIPIIIFSLTLIGYFASFAVYWSEAMSSKLLIVIFMIQLVVPVRTLAGAITFITLHPSNSGSNKTQSKTK